MTRRARIPIIRAMPNLRLTLAAALLLSAPAFAADSPDVELGAIAGAVDPQALHATIAKLVGFGTRHTLSDTVSETRGIGALRALAREQAQGRDAVGDMLLRWTPEGWKTLP